MRNPLATASIAFAVAIAVAACGGGGIGDLTLLSAAPSQPAGSVGAPLASGASPVVKAPLAWAQPAGLPSAPWHWTATNPSGSLMVATAIPGGVYLSHDHGVSWARAALPADTAIWISADMSDDGQVIVAARLNGGLYRSLDGGSTFSRIDAAFNPGENLDYESVAVSADGTRIAAVVMGGGIWSSADGTAATPTFTQATLAGGGALASWWRAVASDASGLRMVAASHNGDVWESEDGGLTFAPLPVQVGAAGVADGWYRLALARDGKTLALAGNEDYGVGVAAGSRSTGLYVGRLGAGGWTFARASDATGNYTRVTIAAAAPVVAATLSGPQPQVLISSDNGATFSPLPTPGAEPWRSIAVTGDASSAVLAGGTFFSVPGSLYVSSGALVP